MTNKITTGLMEWVITHPYDIVIPNFFFGRYEMDVFKLMKSGYVVEYEIKVSKADFKNDFKKGVLVWDETKGVHTGFKHHQLESKECKCNRFYFVTPKGLLTLADIPPYAGLIEANNCSYSPYGLFFETLKTAPLLHRNKFENHFEIAQRLSFRERGLRQKIKMLKQKIANNERRN